MCIKNNLECNNVCITTYTMLYEIEGERKHFCVILQIVHRDTFSYKCVCSCPKINLVVVTIGDQLNLWCVMHCCRVCVSMMVLGLLSCRCSKVDDMCVVEVVTSRVLRHASQVFSIVSHNTSCVHYALVIWVFLLILSHNGQWIVTMGLFHKPFHRDFLYRYW